MKKPLAFLPAAFSFCCPAGQLPSATAILAIAFEVAFAKAFAIGRISTAIMAGIVWIGPAAIPHIFLSSVQSIAEPFIVIPVVIAAIVIPIIPAIISTVIPAIITVITAIIPAILSPWPLSLNGSLTRQTSSNDESQRES